jgi:putative transposase
MRTIVGTAVAQRQLVEQAVRQTSMARRHKRKSSSGGAKKEDYSSLRGVDSRTPIPFVEDIE